ncbi:hypothetical protein M8Z33_04580 [Streptomyces sp. ZAF1911]|nr:hypothetical protein [Streptomyces sp. ZAF1911]MDD9375956.1 hypothetical protein [Streptomyces sp. ZAF1911]
MPCRWGASRFPGKPLARLGNKPLVWTFTNAAWRPGASTA